MMGAKLAVAGKQLGWAGGKTLRASKNDQVSEHDSSSDCSQRGAYQIMLDLPEQLSPDHLVQVATQCACGNFRKATRAVTQFFDESLEPTGLRSTQFVILVAVGAMQPTSIARLAREMVMDPSTLARNLRPLEAQGLVEKVSREGRRSVNLSLTAEGRSMLKRGFPLWQEAQNRFVGHFGGETWERVRGFLAQAVNATRLPDDY